MIASSRLIFDVDSTVLVLHGKQEPAKIGYNSTKRGRPAYHPLLCRESRSKDFWHGELRPGDAHTASGTLELMPPPSRRSRPGPVCDRPRGPRVLQPHVDRVAGAHKAGFVIVARLTSPIKSKLPGQRNVSPSRAVEVAEFRYQRTRWPPLYRFIVMRRLQPEEPTAQFTLVKLDTCQCPALVTNLPLQPLNLWRFDNERAGVEAAHQTA
jgi:hypothetical protein